MAIPRTSLRTTINSGDGGEIADTNAAYAAINALTAALSQDGSVDTAAIRQLLVGATVPAMVVWTGTGWGSYTTDPTVVRIFMSAFDPAAINSPPTRYNKADIWIAD